MGKSNRIRANRANEQMKVQTLGAKKKKKGMPSWAMTLITLVVAFAVLLGVAVSLLSANGVFGKLRTPLSSDHFKISNNMLSYLFYTQYMSFQEDYSDYMSYFSLDTEKSLKDQPFGGDGTSTNYDAAFLGSFQGSWFDFFMAQTLESAKSLLVYCEEARARNITLTDEEKEQIETTISSMESTASLYGYTLNSYISANYGTGVSAGDVRKAMTYSALATKCMDTIADEIEAGLTTDRITAKYDQNLLDFNVVDYTYYTFRVDYSEVLKDTLPSDVTESTMTAEQKTQVLEAYKAAIADAKAKADAMKAAATAEEFMTLLLNHAADKAWKDVYTAQTVADADKPSDEDLAAIKSALIADVLGEIAENKEKADAAVTVEEGATSVTVYEKTVTAAFAGTLNTVKEKVFTSVSSAKTTAVMEDINYVGEDDDFSVWAFDASRVAGEKTVIVTGDGSAEGEVTKTDGYSYVSVYYLDAPQHKDEEKTRNVAYMLFDSEDNAKAAIEVLKGKTGLDLATFETVATEQKSTGNTHVEDYYAGQIGSDVFDDWLFAEETTVGTVTATPLALDEKTFAVAFYYGEGLEKWVVDVENVLFGEDFDAYYEGLTQKYPVTIKEKTWKKIEA